MLDGVLAIILLEGSWFLVWFDFCFTALQHILSHFGRGQLPLTTLFLGKPPRQFTST